MVAALAYYRTSSWANVGDDKDSLDRQKAAVRGYAERHGITIAEGDEFHDPAVSGADPVDTRPGFKQLLARLASNGVKVILVEDPTRFARDLLVQLTGHALLRKLGAELIPANAPDYFTNETPTAVLVQQVLGAIAQFEKASLVHRLKAARERKGRFGQATPVPSEVKELAVKLAVTPPGHKPRSLRTIALLLAKAGHFAPSGKVYGAGSIKAMLRER
jgi:DNA invertase Pin-like site-specific DNA recombinase